MADIDSIQLPDGSQYNLKDSHSGFATENYVNSMIAGISKTTIGLGNVDNTADTDKPVSTAQQTALDGKVGNAIIANPQANLTANKRYEIGDQFLYQGNLYKADAIIASGDAITIGTNAELADSVTEQIKEVNAKIDKGDVLVRADGSKSWASLLNSLYSEIDVSKLRVTSKLIYVGGSVSTVLPYTMIYANALFFGGVTEYSANTLYYRIFKIASSGSFMVSRANTTDTVYENQIAPSGYAFRLVY